jgi:hypothetical protein
MNCQSTPLPSDEDLPYYQPGSISPTTEKKKKVIMKSFFDECWKKRNLQLELSRKKELPERKLPERKRKEEEKLPERKRKKRKKLPVVDFLSIVSTFRRKD